MKFKKTAVASVKMLQKKLGKYKAQKNIEKAESAVKSEILKKETKKVALFSKFIDKWW
ncbi:hypothetical protein VCRA2110O135_170017 [Vibrio crassostreae]|nr:hypothetical protein VCRA2110O135_170017 [Vibrio crassostreae]